MSSFALQALPARHPKSAHTLYVTEHLEVLVEKELGQGHGSGIAHSALASPITKPVSHSPFQKWKVGAAREWTWASQVINMAPCFWQMSLEQSILGFSPKSYCPTLKLYVTF